MKNILFGWLLAILLPVILLSFATSQVSAGDAFSGVHDLAEIFGAVATVAAVCLAFYGFNNWKVEIGAASDHELARRVAVSVRRYRVSAVKAWHCADSCAAQMRGEHWIGPGGRKNNFLVPIHEAVIDHVKQARAELETVALEASVIWGGVFDKGFDEIYKIEQNCCSCINSYLRLLIRGTYDDQSMTMSDHALENWKQFETLEVRDDASIKSFFDAFIAPVEVELKNRLLKGRATRSK